MLHVDQDYKSGLLPKAGPGIQRQLQLLKQAIIIIYRGERKQNLVCRVTFYQKLKLCGLFVVLTWH